MGCSCVEPPQLGVCPWCFPRFSPGTLFRPECVLPTPPFPAHLGVPEIQDPRCGLSSAGRLSQHPSEHLQLPRVPRNPFLSCQGPMARLVSLTLPTLTVLPSWGQSWSPGCPVASGCLQASGALGPLWSKLPSRPGQMPASPLSAAALLSLARVQLPRDHCLPTVPRCGPLLLCARHRARL